jgi:iron complex transport system substrate-binding protein
MMAHTLSAENSGAGRNGAKRVATLIASATEIVSALGCRDWIVGRSHECDYPAGIHVVPVLTEPKIPLDGGSAEIDRHVKAIVEEGASVYRVHSERLKELSPDIIVTQDHCEVCAVSLKDVEQAICNWTGRDIQVVSCRPNALGDIWADIRRIADALGVPDAGDRMVFDMQGRMNAVAARAARAARRPRVLCIEWIDPLMAAADWMPELVEMAGGVNLLGTAGKRSEWITWEKAVASEPDVIVVMPCGFDIARTGAEMPILEDRPGFFQLKAVREGRVAVVDGNQYFNRPGPRLADSLEILAEILHPELFDFGHYGDGWMAWPDAATFA